MRFSFFAALLMPLAAASAQTGSVSGVVRSRTGRVLPAVDVVIPELNATTRTDSLGRYRLREIAAGTHLVIARRIGSLPDSIQLFVKSGDDYEHDFVLDERAVTLDTLKTTAPATKYISPNLKSFEERRVKGFGHFVAEEELRKSDNMSVGTMIQRMPGIQVVPYKSSDFARSSRGGGGGGFAIIGGGAAGNRAIPNDRGSPRGCWVAVYLDGIRIYAGAGSGDNAPDLGRMLVRELAGIEYYAGGASLPAEFSAVKASDCGVLLLWTRER